MRKVAYILISSLTIISTLVNPVDILRLWKPTYEQPSIQAKLQKLAKQHNSFDKLVQHDPLMQKLQKEIAQEGYKPHLEE